MDDLTCIYGHRHCRSMQAYGDGLKGLGTAGESLLLHNASRVEVPLLQLRADHSQC